MDVAEYRKLNKPGWVVQCSGGVYWDALTSSLKYVSRIEEAEAYDNFGEATRVALTLHKFTDTKFSDTNWTVIPIPDLPKKDAEEEIKQGLQDVIRNIDKDKVGSLTYRSIAEDLYDLIARIVEEKLKNQ